MAKIGIRVYRVKLYDSRDNKPVDFDRYDETESPKAIVQNFINSKSVPVKNGDMFRSWHLEPESDDEECFHGLVKYGNFGLTSDIVAHEDNAIKYKRQEDDIEIIPLYYRMWIPKTGNIGFIAHQSYEARSCVSLVNNALVDFFNSKFDDRRLVVGKVVPIDQRDLENAKVKKISLIKKTTTSDLANNMLQDLNEDVKIELSISAKRNRKLGIFKDIQNIFEKRMETKQALVFEGEKYETATAEIVVGKNRQKVGLIGYAGNAGVIDVTADLEYIDGHPTFDSISEKARQIIMDFNSEYG